jgi:glycosyltransferase involved in cell wall biosynthesis
MNILYISYFYPPVPSTGIPAVKRVTRLIRYLPAHKKYILSVRPEAYGCDKLIDSEATLPVDGEVIVRTRTIEIFRFVNQLRNKLFFRNPASSSPAGKFPMNGRTKITGLKDKISYVMTFPDFAHSWMVPAILSGLKIVKSGKVDIIFATGMPWTSLLIGYFLKIVTGKKLIVDFRDPWVENPFIPKSEFEQRIDRRWERQIIGKADLILANTNQLERELVARYPAWKQHIMCLPNGFDLSDFSDIYIGENGNQEFILTHAGLLYEQRDPMPVLAAIEKIYEYDKNIASSLRFHQIGNLKLKYNLTKVIKQKGLSTNVILTDDVDYKTSLSRIANSDALLIFQQGTKNQVPSKLYEYIFFEKPIIAIAEHDGELARLIKQNEFGRIFDDADVDQIAQYIIELYQLKKNGKLKNNVLKHKDDFDFRKIVTRLQSAIERIN